MSYDAYMNHLYLHIPFCRKICPYCDFYKTANMSLKSRFVASLCREIGLTAPEGKTELKSIYMGGGTPSQLTAPEMGAVFEALHQQYTIKDTCEVTVEADPGTFDVAYASMLKGLGVNRISLGAQSFCDDELKQLGRFHQAKDIYKSYDILREEGFENINIDLMCCLPEQEESHLQHSLDEITRLNPEHVSVYALHIEAGSIWYQYQQSRPDRLKLGSQEEEYLLLAKTMIHLRQQGYGQYEISNYARDEHLESVHNWAYWRRVPYLGLGPSAHSFDGVARRYKNVSHVKQYIDKIDANESSIDFDETLTAEHIYMERIMLGLRTKEGVSSDVFSSWDMVEMLIEEGFVVQDEKNKNVCLTDDGISVYNTVVERLI